MAHTPKPHGAFQNGAPASEKDVGFAANLLKKVQAIREAGDLPSHKLVRSLPDGGYVIAQDMGGIPKTIIVKPEQIEPFEHPIEEIDYGFAPPTIPMLYCGHVVEPKPLADGKVKIKLTNTTRRRLGSYDPDKLGPAQIEYKRFTIDYHRVHEDFKPESQGAFFHSQYIDLHPTWWSGAMREVVQVALAFGKQPNGTNDDEVPEEERDVLIVPGKYRELIDIELGRRRLPGYKGRPPESGQISFRFDIQKTHGISFGTDGKPWLIQVDRNGVFAMPLPVIPATTTEAFREWMEDEGDNELLLLIDRFGGVPSGEGFPDTEDLFEAWKKAGVIIKVCEHGGFYGDEMRSQWQSCGWAFSESGKEGFNTCYSYGSDGVKVGHAFKLKLSLGSLKKEKWTLPDFDGMGLTKEEALQLDRYLSGLYRALGRGPESLAVKFKLYNSEASDILGRASSGDGAADVDYWRNLECDPIAAHSGNIAKVGSGKLYAPGLPASHPQIKFPAAAAKGCISFDFSSERILDEEEAKKIKCDTIMLGYYVGDSLKVVKYFRDARELEPEHNPYNAEDGCMFAGRWESTTTNTPTYMWGAFYTTDFDERELAAETESRSVLTAWPGGVSPPFVVPVAFFEVWFSIYRQRAFHNMTEFWARAKYSKYVSVCIPWGNRNAAIHAQLIYPGRREHGLGMFETVDLLDSPSYFAGSFMTNWRWIGRNYRGDYGTLGYVYGEGDGVPFIVKEEANHDLPWVRCGGASESWLSVGQDVSNLAPWVLEFGVAQGPTGGPTPPGDFPAAVHEVEEEGEYKRPLDYSSDAFTGRALEKWSLPYFATSPDQAGLAMKVIGAANACGDAEYSMLTERENTTDPYLSWGKSTLLTKGDIPRFIGVIHE